MGGLSFLFTKKFHPSRRDNQKKTWIAEENEELKRQRDIEIAAEVEKERWKIEQAKKGSKTEGLTTELSFMYQAPPGFKKAKEEDAKREGKVPYGPTDAAAEAFQRKLLESQHAQSELEKLAGKKATVSGMSLETQVERFPILKDAPREVNAAGNDITL
jgi:hypothetical protein